MPLRPVTELCALGDSGCICDDPRLPDEERSYTIPYGEPGCINNIAMTPDSYKVQEDWVRLLIDRLDQCVILAKKHGKK